jgi:hypothetical protein
MINPNLSETSLSLGRTREFVYRPLDRFDELRDDTSNSDDPRAG